MESASAASAVTDPNHFQHVRMVLSMVVSLGIARLLSGLAKFVQHPGRIRLYWVHLLWSLSLLLTLMHFWWWQFSLSHLQHWHIAAYGFVVGYDALFYFLCAILFPDDLAEYSGYRDYFYSRRRWFFGLLALSFVVDVIDTRLKGMEHLAAQGTEYPLRIGAYVALLTTAAIVRDPRFHGALAVLNLLYQVSWILRLYDVLQ